MQQQPVPQYIPGTQGGPAAAPVQPVAYPAGPAMGQAAPQAQGVQQQWQQRMVAIARPLEQTMPGYQILASFLQEMTAAQSVEATMLIQAYTDAVFSLNAALGAVRRFLCGEANQAVLAALAMGVNRFARAQSVLRPQVERVIMGIPAEQRGPLSQITQNLTTAENLVNQAGSIVQATVGPEVWEMVRAQVWESPAPQAAPVAPAPQAAPGLPQFGAPVQQQWQAPQFNWPGQTGEAGPRAPQQEPGAQAAPPDTTQS